MCAVVSRADYTPGTVFHLLSNPFSHSVCLSSSKPEGDPDGGQRQHQNPHDECPSAQQQEGLEEGEGASEEIGAGVPG